MNGREKFVVWLLGSLLLCAAARATGAHVSRNPYQGIVRHNVFALRMPSPAIKDPPKSPPPQVTLTGISTLLPRKCAMLRVRFPPQPGKSAEERSYLLAEGEQSGQVKVLAIDEKSGTVKANICGTIMTLTFEQNGTPLPLASVPQLPAAPPPQPLLHFAYRRP